VPAPRAIVAVLAGGRGERLGGAKACVPLAGEPLIAYPLRAAAAAGLEAIVVAKRSSPLPMLEQRVVYEPEQPAHPLRGVVSALEHAAALAPAPPAVLIVACDMPFVPAELLRWLAAQEGAVMAQLDARAQPALCRLETNELPALRAALAAARPLGEAISALAPRLLERALLERFGAPERICFNVNSDAELSLAAGWLQPDRPAPSGRPRPATAGA